MRYIVAIISALSIGCFKAQDWSLKLSSNVEIVTWKLTSTYEKEERSLQGAKIVLTKGGQVVTETTSNGDGDFTVMVPPNGEYLLTVSYPGCNTKRFSVNTFNVPEDFAKDNYKPTFSIGGFIMAKPFPGIDYSGLQQPLVRVEFMQKKKVFDHDEPVTDNGLAIVTKIYQDENTLIQSFCSTNKAGDVALAKPDCPLAKQLYEKAMTIIPGEQYPVEQLKKVGECLKNKEEAAKKAEEAKKAAEEKALADKAAAEKAAAEKAEADKIAKEKAAAEKAEAAKLAADKAAAEKLAKEKAAEEAKAKAAADAESKKKAAEEKAAADKIAKAKAAAEAKLKAAAEAEAKKKAADEKAAKQKEGLAKSKAEDEAAAKAAAEKKAAKQKAAEEKAAKEKEAMAKAQAEDEAEAKAEEERRKAKAKEKDTKQLDYETTQKEGEGDVGKRDTKHGIYNVIGADKYKENIKKGDEYFKMKRWAEAKKAYEEALKSKADDAYAKQKLEQVNKNLNPDNGK